MASKVNICSMATTLIGANRVYDLDNPGSEEERQCILWWDHAVRELLEEHDWKFARSYKDNLAQSTGNIEYDYSYELPTDCLKLSYLLDLETGLSVREIAYELQGRQIFTDLETVSIVYTQHDTNVGAYPAHFVKPLIFLLAHYISYKLNRDRSASMRDEYSMALMKAVDHDQAQNSYPGAGDDSWLTTAGFSTVVAGGA